MTTPVITAPLLYEFDNGATRVSIHADGTKVRQWVDADRPVRQPESIDLKVTNYCTAGCAYCHESSTARGKHGDLNRVRTVLAGLSPGTELAIGGGNPLDHPDLIPFLAYARSQGWIPNLTVNQQHVLQAAEEPAGMLAQTLSAAVEHCQAMGISLTDPTQLSAVVELQKQLQVVVHVIPGVHASEVLDALIEAGVQRVLLLGYKRFGFGRKYLREQEQEVAGNLYRFYTRLPLYFDSGLSISFDNLAISQLRPERFFTSEVWDQHYMGDDFTHSMYVDAVLQTFAPTSRSSYADRVPWATEGVTLFNYFTSRRGVMGHDNNEDTNPQWFL